MKELDDNTLGVLEEKSTGRNSALNLNGRRFGRLVAMTRAGSRWGKALWLCKCDCGNEKVINSRALISENTTSCGCYHKEVMRELLRNPNITDEEREENRNRRYDSRLIEWRTAVYIRDDRRCQVCGVHNKNLVAHHKDSWNKFKEKRFVVLNGVTCCEDCHKEYHSVFGYGDNTEEEWKSFIGMKGVDNVVFDKWVKRRVKVELVGRIFGRLTVVSFDGSKKHPRWICVCDCGCKKSIDEHQLKQGGTLSCGCLKLEHTRSMGKNRLIDLTGRVSGKFTVVMHSDKGFWICKCKCGKEHRIDRGTILNTSNHKCICGGI